MKQRSKQLAGALISKIQQKPVSKINAVFKIYEIIQR